MARISVARSFGLETLHLLPSTVCLPSTVLELSTDGYQTGMERKILDNLTERFLVLPPTPLNPIIKAQFVLYQLVVEYCSELVQSLSVSMIN